jgi:hypothetical protein
MFKKFIVRHPLRLSGILTLVGVFIGYLSVFQLELLTLHVFLGAFCFILILFIFVRWIMLEQWLHQLILSREDENVQQAELALQKQLRKKPEQVFGIFHPRDPLIQLTYARVLERSIFPVMGGFNMPDAELVLGLAESISQTNCDNVAELFLNVLQKIMRQGDIHLTDEQKRAMTINLQQIPKRQLFQGSGERRSIVNKALEILAMMDGTDVVTWFEKIKEEVDQHLLAPSGEYQRIILSQLKRTIDDNYKVMIQALLMQT